MNHETIDVKIEIEREWILSNYLHKITSLIFSYSPISLIQSIKSKELNEFLFDFDNDILKKFSKTKGISSSLRCYLGRLFIISWPRKKYIYIEPRPENVARTTTDVSIILLPRYENTR